MKTTTFFILLQYVIGFAFAVAGTFVFAENSNSDLLGKILFGFLGGYSSMLIGVALVGYFHLRVNYIGQKFGLALTTSFIGLLLFLVLYVLIERYLPKEFGLLILLLPLTGAVFGFNFIVTVYAKVP